MNYLGMQWFPYLLFCFGLIFGSFLNVVGYRLPRGESVVFPSSHCPKCKTELQAFELIPIVSWLFLHGHCRTCKSAISIWYPVIETITGVVFALAAMKHVSWFQTVVWCLFWLVMVAALACDVTSMRIPNSLTYSGGLVVFLFTVMSHIQSLRTALLGGAVCFLMLCFVHLLSGGNMGLGDAKLYFSIGVMLGPWYGLLSFVLASFFGSIVGILMRLFSLVAKREPIPFAPYIFMGVLVTAVYGDVMVKWYLTSIL